VITQKTETREQKGPDEERYQEKKGRGKTNASSIFLVCIAEHRIQRSAAPEVLVTTAYHMLKHTRTRRASHVKNSALGSAEFGCSVEHNAKLTQARGRPWHCGPAIDPLSQCG
jgi:hypothetical protein